MLNHASHYIGIIFIWACFWSSSFPQLRYTIYVFHFTTSSCHFFWTASPPSTFSLLTEKKLSTDLEDAFVRFKLFWDAMMDTHELLRYYKNQFEAIGWFEKINSLIDFHVVLKAAELLFFRLKILFNWKIIVVEVTETFLSSGN